MTIVGSTVLGVGCGGITAHAGSAATLAVGGLLVEGNEVAKFGRWKVG